MPAIAVGSNNIVRVLYHDNLGNLKVASENPLFSNQWHKYTLVWSKYNAPANFYSIALDSNNKTHVSYYDYTHNALKYISTTALWSPKTGGCIVDSTADIFSSIAVDSNNKVHIAYISYQGNNQVLYATNISGKYTCDWDITPIADGIGAEYFSNTSLALDSNNNAHIVYNYSPSEIRYSTNASGSWTTSIVAYAGLNQYPSITVDTDNKIHILQFRS